MKGLARSPTEGRGRRRVRAGPGRDVELCRFERVTVVFGGLRALNGLEFAVNSDDGVTGIIGPNGAGKSTALAVMMGAVKPAHGRVHVLGHEIRRVGLLLKAIRDDEDAARMVGINAFRLKVLAMGISAAMAGLAGPVYLSVYKIIDPNTAFGVSASLNPVVAGILGGPGSVAGGLVGELILQPVLAETNDLFGSTMFGAQQIVYGAILMMLILVLPRASRGS